MTAKYQKPLPRLYTKDAREFYEGCKQHELLIQRCKSCEKFRFPPQRMCPECHSTQSEWAKVSGKGKVSSFTVIPHFEPRAVPMASWPEDGYPIMVVIVELPDAGGVHVVSNMINCNPEDIKVGMDVKVVFEEVTDEITLPKFERI
jgi:uncharacterized OB-fold protein